MSQNELSPEQQARFEAFKHVMEAASKAASKVEEHMQHCMSALHCLHTGAISQEEFHQALRLSRSRFKSDMRTLRSEEF
jgi:hypothetical protein